MSALIHALPRRFGAAVLAAALSLAPLKTSGAPAPDYAAEVEPILIEYCYDCHGDDADKGDLVLDEYASRQEMLHDYDTWLAIWQNLRSHLMPPAKKSQPGKDERELIQDWIQRVVFEVDPENPDPGRVTIRRLNREEYENTVLDLLGVKFDAVAAFPADDTGYGFDNIGDVLSISPLLMEKYIAAAEEVVHRAIHTGGAYIPTKRIWGSSFKNEKGHDSRNIPFEKTDTFQRRENIEYPGEYEVRAEVRIKGSSEATNHSARFSLLNGNKKILARNLGWDFEKNIMIKGHTTLTKGPNNFVITLEETEAPGKDEKSLDLYTDAIYLRGPLDGSHKLYPEKYNKLFTEGPPSKSASEREAYARKIIRRFVERAYRQPVDEPTLKKLAAIAAATDARPNRSFEDGIAQAFTAVLASPRFLFRAEIQPQPNNPDKIIPVNEFALASRLSYFLWSSMPDEELFQLAREKKLRANLRAQVDRMLESTKGQNLVDNFVGQWLLTRN
ncbi:MAG: DUF1587 domain-containing protein, partial [Verrucomicrobiales bacterium]